MAFKMGGFSGFKKHPLYGKLDAEEKKRYDSLDKTARKIIDGNKTLSQLRQALIPKKELERQREQRIKETG
tara:strand:+ start:173 stop:385 length:213 start_codon:yes stop_codon:yes gene_type:complete